MAAKPFDQIEITGVSNSGTTDGSGSSTDNIDISLQFDLPSSCSGLLIKIRNVTTSPRWAGIRTSGETTWEVKKDFSQNNHEIFFIPLASGQTSLDFYRESSDIQFRVLAAFSSSVVFFDIDSRPTTASASGTYASRTVGSCPINSTAITTGHKWRPTGESTGITNNPSGQQLVKLDSSSAYESASSSTQTVIGYFPAGEVTWGAWLSETQSYTADSTWRQSPITKAGYALAHLIVDKSSTATDYDFRETGSSFTTTAQNAFDENFFTSLNDDGNYDYFIETGSTSNVYLVASVDAISDVASISDIDQIKTGQISRVDFDTAFAATSLSITDGTITKTFSATTVDADSVDGTVTPWVDEQTAVKIGAVTITATDGVDTTEPFAGDLEFWGDHPDDATVVQFTAITLTSVSIYSIGYGAFDPPLKIGTQCVYDAARFDFYDDGEVSGDYVGETNFWFLDPDDDTARVFTLNTSPATTPSGGLTSVAITAVAPTATGITAVGL